MSIIFVSMIWQQPLFANKSSPMLSTGVDPEARLPFWQLKTAGMRFRLVQRLPDQTRGYFLKRGFTLKQTELIAQNCAFQTIFKNVALPKNSSTTNSDITYDLTQWEVIQSTNAKKIVSKLKVREYWEKVWAKHNVKQSARIAFKWSLLPTKQTYRASDYNWGVSIFGLKPGATFSLKIKWKQYGKTHTAIIKDIRCASDIHPETGGAQ